MVAGAAASAVPECVLALEDCVVVWAAACKVGLVLVSAVDIVVLVAAVIGPLAMLVAIEAAVQWRALLRCRERARFRHH